MLCYFIVFYFFFYNTGDSLRAQQKRQQRSPQNRCVLWGCIAVALGCNSWVIVVNVLCKDECVCEPKLRWIFTRPIRTAINLRSWPR